MPVGMNGVSWMSFGDELPDGKQARSRLKSNMLTSHHAQPESETERFGAGRAVGCAEVRWWGGW